MAFLDLFRPPRTEPLGRPLRRGSLTASARVITPQDGTTLGRKYRNRGWQLASFTYRVAIPEVGYVMRFLGNNSTHIRLTVADRVGDEVTELDDDYGWIAQDRDKPPVYDPAALPPELVAQARDALDRLTASSPSGGGAAILAPVVQAFEGPGECYMVGRWDPDTDRESWAIHSVSELKAIDGRYPGGPPDGPRGYWRLTTGELRDLDVTDLDPTTTTVIRLWTADSQWSSEPDSPMRSLVGVCERLLLIDRANDASLRSRASGNGFLLMPDELSFGPDGTEDDPDAPDDDEFQKDFTTQLVTPLTQDGSAASVVPGIIRGPYQYLDRIRHLTLDRPLDPKLAELEARLLTRLGIGLDVPPEVLTGYADVNHWNVNQVSEDTFKLHQEPVTIKAVEAMTIGYLRSVLADAGWPAELTDRLIFWFDPSSLIAPRDQRQAANDAFDRQQISGKAYRRLLHLDEADAPELDDADTPVGTTGLTLARLQALVVMADSLLQRGFLPASVARALGLNIEHTGLLPVNFRSEEALEEAGIPPISGNTVDGEDKIYLPPGTSDTPAPPPASPPAPPDTPAPPPEPPPAPPDTPPGTDTPAAPAEPPAATTAAASSTGAEPTDAQRRLSRRLMAIDRDLRVKLTAAADAALHRALERAGNRLRAKARANAAAAAAVDGVPGPRVAAALGRARVAALDADDLSLLADAFTRLQAQWTEWTAAAAEEAATVACKITGLSRNSPDVQRAVASLRDDYANAAANAWPALEANLNTLATQLMYEPDPTVDPLGELADSLVPPGLIRAALAAAGGISSDSTGLPPLNGFTSGDLVNAFMRDAGAEGTEYEWAYGISARPFEPHEALDGRIFADWNDPVLSTEGTGGEWVGGSFAPGDHDGCHCDYAIIYADGNTRDEQELIGQTAYQEQNPGEEVPGWEATVDPNISTPGRTRPETRRGDSA